MSISGTVVLEDVMNDALIALTLISGIFVKNPNSQAQAAASLKAGATLLQVIEAQLNGTNATPAPAPTAGTTGA